MGINIDNVRKKLDQFKQEAERSTGSKHFWKPEEGKQTIRIIPYAHNKEWPFSELYFNFIFKKTVLSPLSFGQPDPIKEFAEKLKKTGTKEDFKESKRIEPKMRYYAPIIVRDKESEGVKFWGFGKEVYNELLRLISDVDYGDITDIENGIDLTVEYTPKEKSTTSFAQTLVRPKRASSPAVTTKKDLAKIMDQPVLTDLFECPTYDELKTMLKAFVEGSTSDEKEGPAVTGTAKASVEAINKEFSALFKEDE